MTEGMTGAVAEGKLEVAEINLVTQKQYNNVTTEKNETQEDAKGSHERRC